MDLGEILLYVALIMVLLWTGLSARSKGRNPWVWSGAAFIIMILSSDIKLLGVIPMVVLMVSKSPKPQKIPVTESADCPKCQTTLLRNFRYCTNCGWDLAERYYPDTKSAEEEEKPAIVHPGDNRETVTVADPVTQSTAANLPQETPPETTTKATPPPFTPPKKPMTLVPPTASGMTERGVRLFNQGRIQESIDQFTKAIALDPNYTQAWARRAEAYTRLGKGNEAAEDQRRLDTLNASS